jgi:hypothetical protein
MSKHGAVPEVKPIEVPHEMRGDFKETVQILLRSVPSLVFIEPSLVLEPLQFEDYTL